MILRRILLSVLVLAVVAPVAWAGPVSVREGKASSILTDSKGVVHDVKNLFDGEISTGWAEAEASSGLGDWVEFSFENEVALSKMVVYSGNWSSRDFFDRNNRVKSVQVKFANGSGERYELADKMEAQTIRFMTTVKSKSIRLVLKDIYKGSTFNDTYLTEVQFYADGADSIVEPSKVSASSSLKADADASYGPDKAIDFIQDTFWCEGKNTAGIGEAMTLTFSGPQILKELRVLNGVATSEATYKKNNRATKVKIEAGSLVKEENIADEFGKIQAISLDNVKAGSLKLTIVQTAAGLKFNDTCISEVRVIGGGSAMPVHK